MQGKMLLLLCIVMAIWPIYIESAAVPLSHIHVQRGSTIQTVSVFVVIL